MMPVSCTQKSGNQRSDQALESGPELEKVRVLSATQYSADTHTLINLTLTFRRLIDRQRHESKDMARHEHLNPRQIVTDRFDLDYKLAIFWHLAL